MVLLIDIHKLSIVSLLTIHNLLFGTMTATIVSDLSIRKFASRRGSNSRNFVICGDGKGFELGKVHLGSFKKGVLFSFHDCLSKDVMCEVDLQIFSYVVRWMH